MDRFREKSSTFLTKLAYGLGRTQRPTVIPPSKSLGSPAHQTSLIFELPDELILSILSHISPDPWLTSHYARFRSQYGLDINDYHQQRIAFLRPLSMTCRAMQLRLLPWVWERLVFQHCWHPWEEVLWKLDAAVDASHAGVSLAINVKILTVHLVCDTTMMPSFVKCLQSLSNLHTLEISSGGDLITTLLEDALKRVKLPQVKTLILIPSAHPLLKHCCNVEDVVCVIRGYSRSSDGFLGSLASNRDSKITRLAIPLLWWDNTSRYVAACPGLTELTVVYPYPSDTLAGMLYKKGRNPRPVTLELANACKSLPGFDTLQIVYFSHTPLYPPFAEQRKHGPSGEVKGWIDCFKDPKTWCQEGERRKKTTLRAIELSPNPSKYHLGAVNVEEYEVQGFGSATRTTT